MKNAKGLNKKKKKLNLTQNHIYIYIYIIIIFSVPDALRDIYRRNLVDGDFILLYYNCITNFNLNEAIKSYIQRKTGKDGKYNVMTKIYKKLPTAHYLRSAEDEMVVVLNKET